jgi:glycosyltransferase involved in cell wall biosynthesis
MKTVVITSAFLPGNLESYARDKNLDIIRLSNDIKSIFPKWILVLKLLKDSIKCLFYLSSLRKADLIISVFFVSIPILIMRKIRIIPAKTAVIWAGFFVHNRTYFKLFRKLFQVLFTEQDRIIVYSDYERELYAKELGLKRENLHYVPLVFNPGKSIYTDYTTRVDWEKIPEKYFFSGGYSHRDYAKLIEAFRLIPARLVICSSTLNEEFHAGDTPENVTILNDVLKDDFAELIQRSEACLILLKEDTGAAGQLFTLEAMYNRKIVIASSSSILKEMITHETNGFIVGDPLKELPSIIDKIERNYVDRDLMGTRAHENVMENYSKEKHNVLMDLAIQGYNSNKS